MKIRFLGTSAADANRTEDVSSRDYRRNASALIDGCLLIDPGPRVPEAMRLFGIDPAAVRFVINTHDHSDHFCADTLAMLEAAGAQFVPFQAGESRVIGKYTVSAYAANHGTAQSAVHFIVDDGVSRLFYGLDGAWLLWDEIQAIRTKRVQLAVLDATIGEAEGDYRVFEHNNLRMVREMRLSLAPHCDRFVISHMAQSLHTSHAELCACMAQDGIDVAFDGMEIEF